MIRSWFASLFGSRPAPAVADPFLQGFIAGFQYALGPGGQTLKETVFQEAFGQAMKQLGPTIEARAKEAGVVSPRPILELQAKRRDFQAKFDRTQDAKYQHYLEAIDWILPSNGH